MIFFPRWDGVDGVHEIREVRRRFRRSGGKRRLEEERTGDGGDIEGMKEGEVATRVKSSRGVAEARKEHASYRLVFPLTAYFR